VSEGGARMVDVGKKGVTLRRARARGFIRLKPATLDRIRAGKMPKGDVLEVARVAGILAAKRTADLLPLCHPIGLTRAEVSPVLTDSGIEITAAVEARERTGVEMEALSAVAAAALCVYDMCKSMDRGAVIAEVRLLEKSGGRSGRFVRRER